MLRPDDFAAFFHEVHGVDPFPWQRRLLARVAERGEWPATLDLPTGAGKTAAIDIAVFHLGLEAARGMHRRAPVRIAFVVDRRLVVDDAHARACKLQDALNASTPGPVTARLAAALQTLALDGPPLLARRLRGGIPRESDWARSPSQPTVLCSTVDQIGSRLLFRGYGVSDSMKPVHAGLIGADCLILLDEAHLAEPFRQTLGWVERYRGASWRQSTSAAAWGVALLTATPGQTPADAFQLDEWDCADPVLQRRLQARKPVRLLTASTEAQRRDLFEEEVKTALQAGAQAIGVVLNRVARARDLFNQLRRGIDSEQVDLLLLIGPNRPVQRDELARQLEPIRTSAPRALSRPLIVVATQCIEAGVDIDLDALLTEAAPLDALRQRFGRLNRAGRDMAVRAAIIATKEETGARAEDPVYGTATREAWKALNGAAAEGVPSDKPLRKRKTTEAAVVAVSAVDFGIDHFKVSMPPEALTEKPDAPVLMPSHVDLLAQTAPVPAADPEVGLHLHGITRKPDSITVIWRADLSVGAEGQDIPRLLTLMPPRSAEGIELPLWVVRQWLIAPARPMPTLADVPAPEADVEQNRLVDERRGRHAFRWRGLGDDSHWIAANRLRAGDTIVVPAFYGGVDAHGWDPTATTMAVDVADRAAENYRARWFTVRVAPGLVGEDVLPETLSSAFAAVRLESWVVVRDALLKLPLPKALMDLLELLNVSRKRRGKAEVEMDLDAYGVAEGDAPRGVVFVAPRGLRVSQHGATTPDGSPSATEDDIAGSAASFALTLQQHSEDVEAKSEQFASAAGLPSERVADLKLAGWLHDQGKRDARFQRWMHHGDPLGADPDDESTVLAKSARALPPSAREKAGLPRYWRHEALSVRLARGHERLQAACDPDLVLWLVGTHHGHGRPLFPHADPHELAPDCGPQSLAFDWNGRDWSALFDLLRVRYGTWELARMEAILRLADHRASEEAAVRSDEP